MGKGEICWLVKFLGTSPAGLAKASAFETRLKLQKAAFLLGHLGVTPFTDYPFSMYVSGPYSPLLATEYYHLDGIKPARAKMDRSVTRVLKWFASKDKRWLEVASSVISIRDRHKGVGKGEVYSVLTLSKPWVTHEYFDSVVTELAGKGL
ncbi:hypothetical protein MUP07_10160 [Candidatus Bathyarchaeota archaeon]|jgi:uncharacterized protein YwgA|nr:hypothetical protein [Candidatus Bathyarchaeota archaeon]